MTIFFAYSRCLTVYNWVTIISDRLIYVLVLVDYAVLIYFRIRGNDDLFQNIRNFSPKQFRDFLKKIYSDLLLPVKFSDNKWFSYLKKLAKIKKPVGETLFKKTVGCQVFDRQKEQQTVCHKLFKAKWNNFFSNEMVCCQVISLLKKPQTVSWTVLRKNIFSGKIRYDHLNS